MTPAAEKVKWSFLPVSKKRGQLTLGELPYWEACQILFTGKVGLHSLPFRGVEMLYLFVMSHSM